MGGRGGVPPHGGGGPLPMGGDPPTPPPVWNNVKGGGTAMEIKVLKKIEKQKHFFQKQINLDKFYL